MRGVPLRQGECASGHALTLGANTGNYKTGQGVCDVCGRIHPTGELMACSDCQVRRILRLIRINSIITSSNVMVKCVSIFES